MVRKMGKSCLNKEDWYYRAGDTVAIYHINIINYPPLVQHFSLSSPNLVSPFR